MTEDVRGRILEATVTCLGRFGIAKTTVDDASKEAAVSRATVYRHFPDGRDQLISESITWAVGRFFQELFEAVVDETDIGRIRVGQEAEIDVDAYPGAPYKGKVIRISKLWVVQ